MYGGNRTIRRVKALAGGCLAVGAIALGGAGRGAGARRRWTTPTTIPTNAVTDHVTWSWTTRSARTGTWRRRTSSTTAANWATSCSATAPAASRSGRSRTRSTPRTSPSVTAAQLRQPGDTQDRFYEGENMTVDAKRKLVILSRDPRGFGGAADDRQVRLLHHRRQGPVQPEDRDLQGGPGRPHGDLHQRLPVPVVASARTARARRATTRTGSPQPAYSQKRGGVPIWVTDISRPGAPVHVPDAAGHRALRRPDRLRPQRRRRPQRHRVGLRRGRRPRLLHRRHALRPGQEGHPRRDRVRPDPVRGRHDAAGRTRRRTTSSATSTTTPSTSPRRSATTRRATCLRHQREHHRPARRRAS